MDPVSFEVGPVSLAATRLLAGATAAYAVLTGVYAWRGVKARLQDRWSAVACAVVLLALSWILATDGPRLLPAPFSVGLVIIMVAAIVFTLTYTLGRYKERIERFRVEAGARLAALLRQSLPEERHAHWIRLRERFQLGLEERRKAPHLTMGLVVPSYLALGHLILLAAWGALYGGDAQSAEGVQNLYQATHSGYLVGGHMFTVVILLTVLYVIAPTELLRLRFPELSYPFKDIILTRLREREKGLFGAHYYIAAAAPLAVLWVARDPSTWDVAIPAIVAILAVTVFADAASALVGVRYGRRKWFHHPGKSYLGTVGGAVVAVAVSAPLVGIPMALVTGAVFAILDALAPVPLAISDNILNPVVLAAVYLVAWPILDPMVPFY